MFTRSDTKKFILLYGKKILFPDFSNKLTWLIAGTGVAILLAQTPLKIIFYSFIIDTLNINLGDNFTVAELKKEPEYIWGTIIIALSLAHNLSYKYYKNIETKNNKEKKESDEEVDLLLYTEFINLLPSNSSTGHLICKQDYSDPYMRNSINKIRGFVSTWNGAEYEFLHSELEEKKKLVWNVFNKFLLHLETNNTYANDHYVTVIPRDYFNNPPYSPEVEKLIEYTNNLARKCCTEHQEFISLCRQKLRC